MTNDATAIRAIAGTDALQKALDALYRATWRLDALAQLLVLASDSAACMNDGRKKLDPCGISEVGEMLSEVGRTLDGPCELLSDLVFNMENGGDAA